MFERIIKKVGKLQDRENLNSFQVGSNIVGLIPIFGQVSGLISSNVLLDGYRESIIKLEKSFTIEEVQEIVKEVGKEAGVDNSQLITKIMEVGEKGQQHYEEKLWEKDEEIKKLQGEIDKGNEALKKLKEREQQREEEETEKKEQQKKLLESQNQLHSPDKVNLEELKEKHRKLELVAKTNEEILNT